MNKHTARKNKNLFVILLIVIFSYLLANFMINYLNVSIVHSKAITNSFVHSFSNQTITRCKRNSISLTHLPVNLSEVSYHDTCQSPVYTIGFVKTHKCASDTLAALFLRIADEKNLHVLLPVKEGNWNLGWPYPPLKSNFRPSLKSSKRYDMQMLHHMFIPKLWNSFLEPGYKLIGVIRSPFVHFQSVFNYFGIAPRILAEFPSLDNNTMFDTYLDDPELYYNYFKGRNHLWRNPLLYDFGYIKNEQQTVESFLEFIDKQFSLIIIADKMDESLVLLRRKLCWTMRDILIMSKNKSRFRNLGFDVVDDARKLRQEAQYRKWSHDDYLFYETFLKKLTDEIAIQPYFEEELQIYKRIKEITLIYCNRSMGVNKPLKIEKTPFNEEFFIDEQLCDRLKSSVNSYILHHQRKYNETAKGVSDFEWTKTQSLEIFSKADHPLQLKRVGKIKTIRRLKPRG